MYPHERSLVEKMQKRPFVLLGVNSDQDREATLEVLKEERITWRSWWNGGTGGRISRAWQVQSWPTLCVIDHKGIIRFRYEGSPEESELDQDLEKVIREAEHDARR
jgi:hypothetical protein